MRTTITLDDDVARLLSDEMRRTGTPLKVTVNKYLRLGFVQSKKIRQPPFRVEPQNWGLPAGMSYDNVAELLEQIEGREHR